MKRCAQCGQEKDVSAFGVNRNTKDGRNVYCKDCLRARYLADRDRISAYGKKRWAENKDRLTEKHKEYVQSHKEEIRDRMHAYYLDVKSDPSAYSEILAQNAKWRESNRERARAMTKDWNKRVTDKLVRLRLYVRKLTVSGLSRSRPSRGKSAFCDKVGCTFPEMRSALGPKPGEDYQLDHICPLSQGKTEEEIYRLAHFSNLRWIRTEENYAKGMKDTPEATEKCRELLGREWDYSRNNIEKESK